jgi:mannose-6-phosphate isomerase
MAVLLIEPSFRSKVWGSRELEPWFPNADTRVGEVWFNPVTPNPILVKFIYTTEDLSVQVHPTGAVGTGKTEMWHILRAGPGAQVALGFDGEVTKEQVRAAALDGSIVDLLRWYDARPGDTFFTPSGTVHAIGAGVALVEVQQNSDITYRLYDYGRARELHLDSALRVADLGEHPGTCEPVEIKEHREILAACPHFVTERWTVHGEMAFQADPERYVICIGGSGTCGGIRIRPGVVVMAQGETVIRASDPLSLLITYRPLPE